MELDTHLLDPHIQAFELLSDRVSSVEETLALLSHSVRLQEATTYGHLNHRVLGLPCAVTRHKANECVNSRLPGAALHVSALIVTFPGVSYQEVLNLHLPDPEQLFQHFNDAEAVKVRKAQEAADMEFVRMVDADIESVHWDVLGEMMQRILDKRKRKCKTLGDAVVLRPFYWTEKSTAFLMLQPLAAGASRWGEPTSRDYSEVPFTETCHDMVSLFQGVMKGFTKAVPQRLEVFDVCPLVAQAYLDYCRWRYSKKDGGERQRLVAGQLSHLRKMKLHVFFETEDDDFQDAIENDI
jgi:hypothetical protein